MKRFILLTLLLCTGFLSAEEYRLNLSPLKLVQSEPTPRREIEVNEIDLPSPVPRKTVKASDDPPLDPTVPSKIVAPTEVSGIGTKVDPYVFTTSTRCVLELMGKNEGVTWDIEDAPTDTTILVNRYASFSLYEDGMFQIIAYGDGVYSKVWFKIKSGTDPPLPDPVDPVDPEPDIITPAKISVVIIQKQLDLSKVPPAQLQIFTSTKIRDYAATHCMMGLDGKTPEFKIYQKNTEDLSKQSPAIQKGFKLALEDMQKSENEPLLWIAVSNGSQGFSGPLPANEEETLKLLKKYGGE